MFINNFFSPAIIKPRPGFLDFALDQSRLLWHGDHLKRSISKAKRFGGFDSYAPKKFDTFGVDHIHNFFDYLETELSLSNATINRNAAMVTKVFTQAKDAKHCVEVPKFTWRVEEKNPRPLYYTEDQLSEMEAYFDGHPTVPWMKQLIIIGAETGMRLGEILTLTPQSIALSKDGSWWAELKHTKNGEERPVPLNDRVRKALKDLNDTPLRHHRGNEHLFYREWGKMRRDLLQGDSRYVFHTLRHTAATVMANDFAANTAIIGMLLGHKSEKTTQKYIHAKPQSMTALVAKFGLKSITKEN